AFDNRNVDDATVIAWQEVLEPHTLQDALTAVSDYFRVNSTWIMPAHIVERVRAVEDARVYDFKNGYHLNRADEDRMLEHGDWSAQMRGLSRAVRTGTLVPAAYEAYQSGDQPLEAFLNRKAIK
ncbi:MAG: hypothetical protein M3536_06385, partial [Actinomycetota bacterium]|nr:hypothetical protein [Actinomycetota bacterium]